MHDRSVEWNAITVVGIAGRERARERSAYIGPCGDPRHVAPFTTGRLGGADAIWLLESDHRALALVSASATPRRMARDRARRSAAADLRVGQDAIARYALLDGAPAPA